MIRAIIFDMDGVLCDSEEFICAAACEMFKRVYHTVVRPEDFLEFTGRGEDRYLGGVAEKYGIEPEMPRDKTTTYQIYAEMVADRLKPIDGVLEFLALTRAGGLRLAVGTSADRFKMEVNLKACGIALATFDAYVTGSEIEHKKPAPDIFLKAAAKLEVPPAECLVAEDAPSGIQAARAAGCRTLGITTSFSDRELQNCGAEFTAPTFSALPEPLIRELQR